MAIKVYVFRRAGRAFFECQWDDPVTGKKRTMSTKTSNRREAERFAGQLEDKLAKGDESNPLNTTWQRLADRYEAEPMASRAPKTLAKFRAVRGWIERLIDPQYVHVLDASKLSEFQSLLRAEGHAEATIKGNLSALRACLNWGHTMGMVAKVPQIAMPKRVNKMKGRPLTDEEFTQYLTALREAHDEPHASRLEFLARGLWLSGLRLDEAMRLTWRPSEHGLSLVWVGGKLRLKIEANSDKSTKPRLLPLTDDFAAYLETVPESKRTGFVFCPSVDGQLTERLRTDTCSKVLCRAGETAQIVVSDGSAHVKYASAHDLRRSFGSRWAPFVPPAYLQQLMRHSSIQTTMQYYVGIDLTAIESAITHAMQQLSNTLPNTLPIRKVS